MSRREPIPVLFSREDIEERVAEIALQIHSNYDGDSLVVIGVLKGACVFVADLIRAIELSKSNSRVAIEAVDFIGVSSYGNNTRPGEITITKNVSKELIAGKHVLLVDDVLDSGNTLAFLEEQLQAMSPASLEIAVILKKGTIGRVRPVAVEYACFRLESNDFVVGYGMDHAELHRGLPYIGVLDPTTIKRR